MTTKTPNMNRKGIETREAVRILLTDPYVYERLSEAQKSTFRTYRKRLKDGNALSLDKMEELLHEHGFIVLQEKLWTHLTPL